MIWSLLGAFAASVCFGVATVLQAVAARAAPASDGVDPRLLLRLIRQTPFLIGVGLDLIGFLAELAALRSLPLFVVQAIVAANLAVTAVVSARVLRMTLSRQEWLAIAGVCVGLALLGLSSGREHPSHVGPLVRWALLGSVAVLFGVGMVAGRLRGRPRAVVLGLIAGLGFAVVAIGGRVLTSLAPLDLLRDPTAYALVGGGGVSMLFFTTALQRGSVTTTTAAVVVAETVVPALLGITLLGDQTRRGFALVAVIGFALAVACTLVLARFGEPAPDEVTSRQTAGSAV